MNNIYKGSKRVTKSDMLGIIVRLVDILTRARLRKKEKLELHVIAEEIKDWYTK